MLPSAPPNDVRPMASEVRDSPLVRALLEAVDGGVLILNTRREILAADTSRLCRSEPRARRDEIAGLRVGEVLRCHHGAGAPSGCGTGNACQDCGVLAAVAACERSGVTEERECLLRIGEGDSVTPLELRARASRTTLDGEPCIVVALRDISGEKRREVLEQVFFHDLLNTVAALSGWTWTLSHGQGGDPAVAAERAGRLVEHLGREVAYQRTLLDAERGTLQPRWQVVDPGSVLEELASISTYHAEGRSCSLSLTNHSQRTLVTDPVLLVRVLVNMVKNAIEASPSGAIVAVACDEHGSDGHGNAARRTTFSVHNDGEIPERARPHVFQRSFTTKPGKGRGLGTYGMKLLGERWLGGALSFTTSNEAGTTFLLSLPSTPARAPNRLPVAPG